MKSDKIKSNCKFYGNSDEIQSKKKRARGMPMITLNDYLYSGDTVLKILQNLNIEEPAKRCEEES